MLKTSTIGNQIYKQMRREILEMSFLPGEKISEAQLATKYNVSRAPIRDAIRALEQERLVIVKPQVGTIISPVSLDKAVDICQIRLLLEPHAAYIAAKMIPKENLANLEIAFSGIAKASNKAEEKKRLVFETDLNLHKTIWKFSKNDEIDRILNGYIGQMGRIRLATAELADRLSPSEKEMGEIFSALRNRNKKEAREAMYTHIFNIKKAVEGVLKSTQTEDQD
jgi:DNA-binding GntR family transcriptional regulator